MAELDKERTVYLLNRILESELAGVVRYTHYSFLVFGHNRIPIVSWMREQAAESLTHAHQAGEMITMLGEYPSLTIGPLLDSYHHDVDGYCQVEPFRPRWGAKGSASCSGGRNTPLRSRI
jgi:bacterioferritin